MAILTTVNNKGIQINKDIKQFVIRSESLQLPYNAGIFLKLYPALHLKTFQDINILIPHNSGKYSVAILIIKTTFLRIYKNHFSQSFKIHNPSLTLGKLLSNN